MQYENALIDMINGSTADKVVMSAEALCFMRTRDEQDMLRTFLARIERRIRAVVVFRGEAKWRHSWREQCLRHPDLAPILDSLPEHLRVEGAWYYDKQAVRDFWRGLVELDEIEYREGEDMTPVLFEWMGVSTQGLQKVRWLNPTQKPLET